MAVKTDTQEIIALRLAVEKRFGRQVKTRADFSILADDIERITNEHISENTLRRLWGRISGYETVFTRTLDVICKYIGHEHWNLYCKFLKDDSNRESEIIRDGMTISVEDLKPGDRIRMGWLPDRICIIEYVGGHTFKTLDAINSTLQIGDTFECSIIIKGFPLFLENLVHGGEHCNRYSIGMQNGITILERL